MTQQRLTSYIRSPWVMATIFFCAALAVRLYHLEFQSLWNDEAFSFDVVQQPFTAIQSVLIEKYHHPPLFFYCAHISIYFFGAMAWALRLPSVIFGALTVGLVFFIANRFINRTAGVVAGIFCLISPFHIAYSQEGRPYALAAFLVLGSCYLFLLVLQQPKYIRQTFYVITSVALLYTHHWGLFVIASQGIVVLLLKRSFRKKLSLITLFLPIGLCYLPEFFALRTQITGSQGIQWFWSESPSFKEMYHLTTAFSGTYFNLASSIFALPLYVQIIGSVSLLVVIGISATLLIRRKETNDLRILSVCSFGTLLIPFIISFVRPEIFLWYRYTVIVFPMLSVVLAGFLGYRDIGLMKKGILIIAAGILIATGIFGDVRYASWQKSNAKDVADYVDEVTSSGVSMIIRPKTFAPLLNYYYKGSAVQYDEAYLETPLGTIVDTASAFVYVSLDVPNIIRDYMNGHFIKSEEQYFPGQSHMGIIVGVYRQPPDDDGVKDESKVFALAALPEAR